MQNHEHCQRTTEFSRNPDLEGLLDELNVLLGPAEQLALASAPAAPDRPVVLILGAARSGTTLSFQWLAASGLFAYPSNLLARFYGAPYVGALVQKMMADERYRFRSEFEDLRTGVDFRSDNGKTGGMLAPNEFWYFWRRFFRFDDVGRLAPVQPDGEAEYLRELAALQHAFGKPWLMKAGIMNFHLPLLDRLLPKALFIHVERDPLYNANSLWQARLRQYGDALRWYSFKPPEYPELAVMEPMAQIVGQIFHTNRHIAAGLRGISDARKLSVDYDVFCADPAVVWEAVAERLAVQGESPPAGYIGPAAFTPSRELRFDAAQQRAFDAAYRHFYGRDYDGKWKQS